MSDENKGAVVSPSASEQQAQAGTEAAAGVAAQPQQLESIEEIDFLLEEIESKIAPLALA